jgi:hypothetical protein
LGSLEATANTVTVLGAGRANTVVSAGGANRDLFVGAGTTLTVEGMTFSGGNAGNTGYGGGIESAGTLTVKHSAITGNRATAGGGLSNAGGTLVISHSQVTDNEALYYGGAGLNNGGVRNVPGSVTIAHSAFVDNFGGGDGGAILNGQNGHPATASTPAVAPEQGRGLPGQAGPTGLVLTVKDSTFTDNRSGNAGGAVSNDGGAFSITRSTLDSNSAGRAVGGAISSGYGSLSVSLSTLDHNSACYGGGIELFNLGTFAATITQSTISNNFGCVGGGLDASGAVAVTGTTFSDNHATGSGAAMQVEGSSSFSLSDSTVSDNTAASGDAAVETYACSSGTVSFVTFAHNSTALGISCHDVSMTGTILAGSTDGANCVGAAPVETTGYNLDSGTSCALGLSSDLTSTDPRLGSLGFNGGPTMTMALKAGSRAIDHGGTASTGCPVADQRGVPRPQGPSCDIGAFEKQVAGAS